MKYSFIVLAALLGFSEAIKLRQNQGHMIQKHDSKHEHTAKDGEYTPELDMMGPVTEKKSKKKASEKSDGEEVKEAKGAKWTDMTEE